MKSTIALFMVMFMVTGCGKSGPTLDGSSEEALRASVTKIHESLPEKEAEVFGTAYVRLVFREGFSGKSADEVREMLDGKTADDVIRLAKR